MIESGEYSVDFSILIDSLFWIQNILLFLELFYEFHTFKQNKIKHILTETNQY